MFKNRILAGYHVFTFSELDQIPDFFHLIVGRPSEPHKIDADRSGEVASIPPVEVLRQCEIDSFPLFPVRQLHSDGTIILPSAPETTVSPDEADGIIALEAGTYPVIRTADCLSLIAVIAHTHSVGIFHAGWRGTCQRIAEKGIVSLLQSTGARPEDAMVGLGPAIRQCCYEVGPEVKREFVKKGHDPGEFFTNGHLDLVKANQLQLRKLGIHQIFDSGLCTACHPEFFFSYRRDRTNKRMWTIGGFKTT